MTTPIDERLAAFLAALDKLPAHRGLTYRGNDGTAEVPRRATPSGVLVSTSRDLRVATENFRTPGVFAVISSSGRDLTPLSAHRAEREVVFRPGSIFLPIEHLVVDGLRVTIIEEIDTDSTPGEPPAVTLDELRDQVRADVVEARQADPATITSPGKFVGRLD
ncbi:MAG: hypothetical protein JWO76_3187 [Nocardioides sp.]|nr:hypothetical protein [Nocardioides sp.]